jgi:hypothetical protein
MKTDRVLGALAFLLALAACDPPSTLPLVGHSDAGAGDVCEDCRAAGYAQATLEREAAEMRAEETELKRAKVRLETEIVALGGTPRTWQDAGKDAAP